LERRIAHAREDAAHELKSQLGLSTKDIMRYLGVSTTQAVRTLISRARERRTTSDLRYEQIDESEVERSFGALIAEADEAAQRYEESVHQLLIAKGGTWQLANRIEASVKQCKGAAGRFSPREPANDG